MNILLVSISAPPKNSPESLQTGRYLKHLSRLHNVTLLTSSVVGGWEPEDKELSKYLAGVRRIELKSLPGRLNSILSRLFPSLYIPDESFYFFWQVRSAIRLIGVKPDVIISRAAPFSSSIMALKLTGHWQVPWLMHLSDMWSDSPFLTGSSATIAKHRLLEETTIRKADIVSLTSTKVVDFYKAKYPDIAYKFILMPNVFDEEEANPDPIDMTGKLRIVFTGRLYATRTIDAFAAAMEEFVLANPGVQDSLDISIAGYLDEQNVERIAASTAGCIKFVGALEYKDAVAIQRNAHMLLVIDALEQDERYEMFFPSKLLDYLNARRFILAFTKMNSSTHEVVEGMYGKCFSPENMHDFSEFMTEAVRAFRQGDRSFFYRYLDNDTRYSAARNAELLSDTISLMTK